MELPAVELGPRSGCGTPLLPLVLLLLLPLLLLSMLLPLLPLLLLLLLLSDLGLTVTLTVTLAPAA